MMRTLRTPSLKVHLLLLIGYLLRYASFIDRGLADTDIVMLLSELLRESDTKIRRRAMCALGIFGFFKSIFVLIMIFKPTYSYLGELIFYVATQEQTANEGGGNNDETSESKWVVPNSTITLILRILRGETDDIVKHYAAKTIENVAAQCPDHALQWYVIFSPIES